MHLWLAKVSTLSEYEYTLLFGSDYFKKISYKSLFHPTLNIPFFLSVTKI